MIATAVEIRHSTLSDPGEILDARLGEFPDDRAHRRISA